MQCPDGAEGIKAKVLRCRCLGGADVGQGGCVWPRAVTLGHQVKVGFPLHHRVPEKGHPTKAVKCLLRGVSNFTHKISGCETVPIRNHSDESPPQQENPSKTKKLKTPKKIKNKNKLTIKNENSHGTV